MLNISWINEQITVGAAFLDEDIPQIKEEDIEAIVDMRSEYCDNAELLKKYNIDFLNIKVDDRYSPTAKQLKEIFNFIEPFLDKGKKILIHCQNGCGRSPLVAISILVKRGMNIQEAVNLIEEKHPCVGFTPQQEEFVYNLRIAPFGKTK